MKLRNKKTGEVIDAEYRNTLNDGVLVVCKEGDKLVHVECYFSPAELNEEWEDYEEPEPLIKNEKIRKAVRAWADANTVQKVEFEYINMRGSYFKDFCGSQIVFYGDLKLTNRETYTITELCGEEEAPEPLEPSFIDLDERIKEKAAAEKLYKGENDIHLIEEEE